ncbi:hypothetical protein RHGRI_029107 [Rhododendron griersonianum]|uniref:CCHC-type domain-containing protein n=1 Tax=Rhododendron griersonianum TaxID=479676 RepID=A0AAV6ILU6_9ERIC|nr:hypothetical protein RHGRI_029107 [Rhododendron griersonianum]
MDWSESRISKFSAWPKSPRVQSETRGRTSDGRSGGNNRSGSSSRGKGVQCYSCKEFGHVKRDCPLRKNKGKKFEDASSSSSLVVADDGDLLTISEERTGRGPTLVSIDEATHVYWPCGSNQVIGP